MRARTVSRSGSEVAADTCEHQAEKARGDANWLETLKGRRTITALTPERTAHLEECWNNPEPGKAGGVP